MFETFFSKIRFHSFVGLATKAEETKFRFSKPTETFEISDFHQFSANFWTSGGSGKFGDMITLREFRNFSKIRVF
eukprot:UN22793